MASCFLSFLTISLSWSTCLHPLDDWFIFFCLNNVLSAIISEVLMFVCISLLLGGREEEKKGRKKKKFFKLAVLRRFNLTTKKGTLTQTVDTEFCCLGVILCKLLIDRTANRLKYGLIVFTHTSPLL